ncbi:sensor histidine kinase [Thiocystis minor]|uniref:sensor histidine kinase n=1 Tax=Thiocystis minor TaxID=61597 RepID=UPI0019130B66|nr:ATP-binding protein [Thiocystis minor]
MRWRTEPSLAGRLLLALAGAFLFVWIGLFVFFAVSALLRETGEIDTQLMDLAEAINATLDEIPTDEEAQTVTRAVAAISRRQIAARLGEKTAERLSARLVVLRASGELLYRAPDAPDIDYAALSAGFSTRQTAGQVWRLLVARSERWTTLLADPERHRRDAVLEGLGLELAGYVLAALVLVLAVMWFAVRRGLAPLRQLSDVVAARAPGDLSPLGIGVRHRELRPLVDALETLMARQSAALARESAFVHDAAHELRTPLAALGAQVHVLTQAEAAATRQEAAQRLAAILERVSRIAWQLLRLAQLDDSAGGSPLAPLDLMPLIADAVADQDERARSLGIELSLVGPERASALADPLALRGLMDNLLDNALRHGGSGGHVEIQVESLEDHVRVSVTDDGPGIPEAERGPVFERFRRGRLAVAPGAGLGLTIVRQAAQRMGGEVVLTEGPGNRGCRFEVKLRWAPARDPR